MVMIILFIKYVDFIISEKDQIVVNLVQLSVISKMHKYIYNRANEERYFQDLIHFNVFFYFGSFCYLGFL